MEIIRDIYNIQLKNTIVTLGKFDGNHKGHRLLFDKAVSLKRDDMKACIFTFDVSPYNVVNHSDKLSFAITSHDERELQSFPEGIDFLIEFPFNRETMSMEPETFVKEILVDRLDVKYIVVGVDFMFGRNRSGNVDTLKELGNKYGFTVFALEKLRYRPKNREEELEISSTLIKEEILKGNMEDAANMMGRPFSVTGPILHGKRLGNTIGFPTVNQIVPEDKILPPDGVYATKTIIDGISYISITNVGKRPTFEDGEHRTVETNIFDFDGDLYGRVLTVEFYKFIRPERKFNGIDELITEIDANKIEVNDYFCKSKIVNKNQL